MTKKMDYKDVSILVIDDEISIVTQLDYFLSRCGFSVTALTDSVEARELIQRQAFDIVLTDLKMPRVSGMDILAAVQKSGRDTKVIVITAYPTVDTAIESISYGVHCYIRKPFQLDDLRITVSNAAEKLFIERENSTLNRQIQRLYAQITTIYEVAKILYQLSDAETLLDMVLDTLTEGIGLKRVALMLEDPEEVFAIYKSQGLGEETRNSFRFSLGDMLASKKTESYRTVVLRKSGEELSPNGLKLEFPPNIDRCVLVPSLYRDVPVGYIAAFLEKEPDASLKEKQNLLEVVTTLIAPLLHNLKMSGKEIADWCGFTDQDFQEIIRTNIEQAQAAHGLVTFIQMKLMNKGRIKLSLPLTQLNRIIQKCIRNEFDGNISIVWQNFDLFLLISKDKDIVSVELLCAKIKRSIESLFAAEDGTTVLSCRYAVIAYPINGNSVEEIIDKLNLEILNPDRFADSA